MAQVHSQLFNFNFSQPFQCSPDVDLDLLRHHAALYDSVLITLGCNSARIKSAINMNASPIFRLPNELLSEIMRWACDSQQLSNSKPLTYERFGSHLSPVILGQVCHHWREVSMNDSRLWTFLWVDLTYKTSWKDVEKVNHWFKLSKKLPMIVNITHNDDTRLVDEACDEMLLNEWKPCVDVVDAIFNQSHRIESLFFSIVDSSWRTLLENKEKPRQFPRLKHLTLNNTNERVTLPFDINLFSDAPILESLDLLAVDCDPSRLHLPWGSLKRLRACSVQDISYLFTILKSTPILETIHIKGLEVEDIDCFNYQEPITLPKLLSLHFLDDEMADREEDSDENQIFKLFDILYCPSLARFNYTSSSSSSSTSSTGHGLQRTLSRNIIPHLIPFLSRIERLVSLVIPGIQFTPGNDDLKDLINTVPSILCLALDLRRDNRRYHHHNSNHNSNSTYFSTHQFLDLLQRQHHDERDNYLPNLRVLRLETDSQLPFDQLFNSLKTRSLAFNNHNHIGNYHSHNHRHHQQQQQQHSLASVLVNVHRTPKGFKISEDWKNGIYLLRQYGLRMQCHIHS